MGTVLKNSAVVFVAVEVFRLELIDSLPSKLQNRSPWRRKRISTWCCCSLPQQSFDSVTLWFFVHQTGCSFVPRKKRLLSAVKRAFTFKATQPANQSAFRLRQPFLTMNHCNSVERSSGVGTPKPHNIFRPTSPNQTTTNKTYRAI